MKLVDTTEAANLMDVPVEWVIGMTQQGLLAGYDSQLHDIQLLDADEISFKNYDKFKVPSMQHIRSMLKKLSIETERI